MATLDDARRALRARFGYPDFRGGQARAVEGVLQGRDVLVLMPTGGGKSLCYQVPALCLPGLTIVVSPLISLMQDQVAALERRGIAAAHINSTLPSGEAARRLAAAVRGELRLLYVAPERFGARAFREAMPRLPVSLLAVDEAHCISQWGHNFRPAYLGLGDVRRALGAPCIALTASATPEVRSEIAERLGLTRPVVVSTGFDRPNLAWHAIAAPDEAAKDRGLLALLRRAALHEGVAVVYAATRKETDELADLLNRHGVSAAAYHAGVAAAERERLQEAFMEEAVRVVVATSAFGMGIDKPNVRLVVHHRMPASLEAYYQEAGRAGRDGEPADCALFHAPGDRTVHDFLIGQSHPPIRAVRALAAVLSGLAAGGRRVRSDPALLLRMTPALQGEGQLASALRALQLAGALRPGAPEDGHEVYDLEFGDPRDLRLDGRREAAAAGRERACLDAMEDWVFSHSCRRARLLRYFGERGGPERCAGCDRCLGPGEALLPGVRPPGPTIRDRRRRALAGARRKLEPLLRRGG